MRIKDILKKAVVLTLAAALTVSVVPTEWTAGGEALAEESEEKVYGDFKYVVLEDGTVEISGYTGKGGDVTIPESIEGRMVTRMGDIFDIWDNPDVENIVSLNLPKGIESLGPFEKYGGINGVFYDLDKLETIDVDKENEAYYSQNGVLFDKENQALLCYPKGKTEQNYSVPEEIKVIGLSAFYDCIHLVHVELPNGLTQIKASAFENCTNLLDISIPDSVTLIGSYAFSSCESIENVTIPANTSLENSVFYGCTGLKNILVEQNNETFTSKNGVLFKKVGMENSLYFYPPAKENQTYEIPEGVTTIVGGAFRQCENLLHLQIPESLVNIEDFLLRGDSKEFAFYGCNNIESFSVDEKNDTFYSEDGVLYQLLENEQKMIFRYPCGKKDKVYVMPDDITDIGESAFEKSVYLENITLNDGLKRIKTGAFYGCSGLTDIVIPESVEYISSGYFSGAYTPDEGRIFAYCTSLKSVVLPSCLTIVGSEMFCGCSNLTSIDIPDNVKIICCDAFSDCTALKSIHLPQGLELIHYYAFSGCSSLEDIQLPEGLQRIGWEAFEDCERLSGIRIPDSVTEIGNQALGYTWDGEKMEGFRIRGGEGTEAQRYAKENGFSFNDEELVNPDPTDPDKPTDPTDPTTPTNPTNPTNPTDQTNPTDPTKPGENQQQESPVAEQPNQNAPTKPVVAVGQSWTDEGKRSVYTVVSVNSTGGTVTYAKPASKISKLVISASVTIEGKIYQVTEIAANAFKGQKKLKILTIPASVTKIGNNAFKTCKNLKKLIIKSKKLTKKSVGKQAFKGLTKKTVVQVPKKKLKAYKKLFKQCGLSKNVKVRGK